MLRGQAPLAAELSEDLPSEPCPGWQHLIWGGEGRGHEPAGQEAEGV